MLTNEEIKKNLEDQGYKVLSISGSGRKRFVQVSTEWASKTVIVDAETGNIVSAQG